MQTITFSPPPQSGTFTLTWKGSTTTPFNWSDGFNTIQTQLQSISGLSQVVVSGTVSQGSLVVSFAGVAPIVSDMLSVTNNSLTNSGSPVVASVASTDVTLPLALSNAFNLNGTSPAIGNQLNTLGKYAGVTRTGSLSTGQITLNDADFLSLIQFAVLKNSAGSSLATIQQLLYQFFPNEVLVFDYQNMQMSYLISSSIGSQPLAQLLVAEKLLMRPMGVSLASVIYLPNITNLFGFRTYLLPGVNNSPFNNYITYTLTWPWVSYANAISA